MSEKRKAELYEELLGYIIDVKDHDLDDLIRCLKRLGFTEEECKSELPWIEDEEFYECFAE